MLRTRVMPCLLLQDEALVKTVKFSSATYIGDPINSVRIYNELEVDELIFLDINASQRRLPPPFKKIKEIATECFMPFSYGGGIRTLDDVKRLFDLGVEKVAINTAAVENPSFISQIASIYGSQSVIVAMDVKRTLFGKQLIYTHDGKEKTRKFPLVYAKEVEQLGAGEILLNSVDRDGTMQGFDIELIYSIANSVNIPLIALGGAGELGDIVKAKTAGASAVALGSMAVYQNKNKGILINFPEQSTLRRLLEEN